MPYFTKKEGSKKCVYKKEDKSKVGCTKGDIKKYLAALHANENKENLNEMKKSIKIKFKKPLKESVQESALQEGALQNNVKFWVVLAAKTVEDNPMDLVFESDPISFAHQIAGGLNPQDVYGFYLEEDEALNKVHDLVSSTYNEAKSLEEKKGKVSEKLQKRIDKLTREVNNKLKMAKEMPEQSEVFHAEAEIMMEKIKMMRDKHKLVEKSKRELPVREEKNEKK